MKTFLFFFNCAPSVNAITVGGVDDVANLAELPYAMKPCSLSPKGGMDRCERSFHVNLGDLVGRRQTYRNDTVYQSTNSGVPTRTIFLYFGILSPTGTNFTTAGITTRITIAFTTEWNERLTLPVAFKKDVPPKCTKGIDGCGREVVFLSTKEGGLTTLPVPTTS